jgi:hypothetical protein
MKGKHKYKIGDIVWVVKPGHTFGHYADKFLEMGFAHTDYHTAFDKFTKAEIWGVSVHEDNSVLLYALRNYDGAECLIGEMGISLCTSVSKELTPYPDDNVEYQTLHPSNGSIQWHPATKMITLRESIEPDTLHRKLTSPKMGSIQIIRLFNPETGNYADYDQTGWNSKYAHYYDALYGTHLRLDVFHII